MARAKRKKKFKVAPWIWFLVALLLAAFFAMPFVYMLLMSLMKDSNEIMKYPPRLFSDSLYFSNFLGAWEEINFGQKLLNTILLTIGTMGIGISASVIIAFGFARFHSKAKNALFMVLLSTMMIPWVVTMIPAYAEYEWLGWIGTYLPFLIPWIGGSAFNIFMLRQFMEEIPKELDEAAEIDGCNSFQTLIFIILPQMKPILATLAVFSFINSWSDYLGPSIYLQGARELWTLSLGMEEFFSSTGDANWAYVMAASVMFAIPMVIVISVAQKAFVRGITTTGIK